MAKMKETVVDEDQVGVSVLSAALCAFSVTRALTGGRRQGWRWRDGPGWRHAVPESAAPRADQPREGVELASVVDVGGGGRYQGQAGRGVGGRRHAAPPYCGSSSELNLVEVDGGLEARLWRLQEIFGQPAEAKKRLSV